MQDRTTKINRLNKMIVSEKGYIKKSIILALSVVIIFFAIAGILLSFGAIEKNIESIGQYTKVAAALLVLAGPVFGGFTMREYYTKTNRIEWLNYVKDEYKRFQNSADEEEIKEIDKTFATLLSNDLNK